MMPPQVVSLGATSGTETPVQGSSGHSGRQRGKAERTPDGVVWGASSYRFWSRYLEVFDRVRMSRVCVRLQVRPVRTRASAPTSRSILFPTISDHCNT
jgi:hypothetical protein